MIGCLTHLKSPSLKELDATINLFTERWPINSLSCTMDVSKDRMMQTIIKECFRYSTVEEILAALEKEGSAFSMKTRDDMLKASPTALKITLELLCQASNLSFIDSIILERRLWNLDMVRSTLQHKILKLIEIIVVIPWFSGRLQGNYEQEITKMVSPKLTRSRFGEEYQARSISCGQRVKANVPETHWACYFPRR